MSKASIQMNFSLNCMLQRLLSKPAMTSTERRKARIATVSEKYFTDRSCRSPAYNTQTPPRMGVQIIRLSSGRFVNMIRLSQQTGPGQEITQQQEQADDHGEGIV